MNLEVEVEPTLRITFTAAEASWLLGFIQNYPQELPPESMGDQEYRQELFELLKDGLS